MYLFKTDHRFLWLRIKFQKKWHNHWGIIRSITARQCDCPGGKLSVAGGYTVRPVWGWDAHLGENLRLLAPGEGIVLVEGEAVFTSWRAGGKMDQSANSGLQDSDRDV
jgi:hypothetical protein